MQTLACHNFLKAYNQYKIQIPHPTKETMRKIKLDNTNSVIKLLGLLNLKNKEIDKLSVELLEICTLKENRVDMGKYHLAAKWRNLERRKINDIVKKLRSLKIIKKNELILHLDFSD